MLHRAVPIFQSNAAARGASGSFLSLRSPLSSLVLTAPPLSAIPSSSRALSSCRAGKGRSSRRRRCRRRRRVVPRLPLLLFPRPRPTLKPPSVSPLLRFPRFHRGPAPPLQLLLPHGRQSTAALAPS
ncbi:hypothetical protein PVAP13_2KG348209 [Panicum virgatum]|uniref:Uncharacterized protein n=1 Tax=Panicum virgatum TaxID=38727 RepID=A0A8T0WD43_PANVG|nr:hypothetical protein PVAP13_2KG348209 [Panicum virgatum]